MESKKTDNKILHFFLPCPRQLENEDPSAVDCLLENSLATAGQEVVNELTISMQKVMEEPINLSIKKSQHCTSPSELLSNTSFLPVNARIRQSRSKEGTRLLIISFRFWGFFFFLNTVQCKHGKAICLLIYLHVNVLFQQASNVIRVLNPVEKCVWSHLWGKNMEMICFEFVTFLICEAETCDCVKYLEY